MKQHALTPGSAEWHQHRACHFNASDAPAMMGVSPYETRSQLIHRLYTGIKPDVDAATQRRFDEGHRFEALARPLAEEIIGQELYEQVGTKGELSASFDGLTIDNEIDFEHKRLNNELRAVMVDGCSGVDLHAMYRIQMEQQLEVADARKALFMASEWDGEELVEERHCWYLPDLQLRAEIIAGWKVLAIDLAAYVPPAAAAVVVAEPVQSLPAVTVIVAGNIAIKDNFAAFEVALRDFLEHRLIREPKTDQDFADLGLQIKAMKGAEAALESAESQMLAQIQTVDAAKKTKDMLLKLVGENRKMAEKLLASEKERRRGEIVSGGIAAFREHIAALNARLGKPYMPAIAADFALAIKGMSSMSSMENAVATKLANLKIEANAIADRLDLNLRHLRENAAKHSFLFADTAQIILKPAEDLQTLVKSRISDHEAAEKKKADDLREQIRLEEEARARAVVAEEERQRQAEADRLQQERDREAARQAAEAAKPAATPAPAISATEAAVMDAIVRGTGVVTTHIPHANVVVPMGTRPPAVDSTATIRLGKINECLAPIQITAAGLAALGFTPVGNERAAVLFRLSDFPAMCDSIVASVRMAQHLHLLEAA